MVLKNSSQILQSLFTTVQHHTIFIPMAVVYPHSAVTVIQLAVKSCAVHQFNSFGNIHTLPLLWYSQGIYPNLPKFSLRRQQGLLQRAVKGKFCELHQGIAGEAVQVLHVLHLSDRQRASQRRLSKQGSEHFHMGSWTVQAMPYLSNVITKKT